MILIIKEGKEEKKGIKESTENDPHWRDKHNIALLYPGADNAMQTREDNLVLVH